MLASCAIVAGDYDTARYARHAVRSNCLSVQAATVARSAIFRVNLVRLSKAIQFCRVSAQATSLAQSVAGNLALAKAAIADTKRAAAQEPSTPTSTGNYDSPAPNSATKQTIPDRRYTGDNNFRSDPRVGRSSSGTRSTDDSASFDSVEHRATIERVRQSAAFAATAAVTGLAKDVSDLQGRVGPVSGPAGDSAIQKIYNTMSSVDLHIQRLQNPLGENIGDPNTSGTEVALGNDHRGDPRSMCDHSPATHPPRSTNNSVTDRSNGACFAGSRSRTHTRRPSRQNESRSHLQSSINDDNFQFGPMLGHRRPAPSPNLKRCLNPGCDSK